LKYMFRGILRSNRYNLTTSVISYIESKDCDFSIEEKNAFRKFFKNRLVSQISYCFIQEYHYRIVHVLWDKRKQLHYVLHHGRKLYFKKGMSKFKIRELYNALCIEQDVRSPHSYFSFPLHYHETDVAADIGAAEGMWALDIIDKVKTIYLFECEDSWIEALYATFEPWNEKVHIVKKIITDYTDKKHTTLDDYFCNQNNYPTIIKADIEGEEIAGMKGAQKLLSQHIRYAILCTYHNFDDFMILSDMMTKKHFKIQPSEGYITAIYSEPNYDVKDISKIFRKGVIHAFK